ncbi:MAG: hypothetical protein QOD11_1993, partial [Bradyrhizobium sp.]|nr:hypothetical protein [Bradyrhizobium sp.]
MGTRHRGDDDYLAYASNDKCRGCGSTW